MKKTTILVVLLTLLFGCSTKNDFKDDVDISEKIFVGTQVFETQEIAEFELTKLGIPFKVMDAGTTSIKHQLATIDSEFLRPINGEEGFYVNKGETIALKIYTYEPEKNEESNAEPKNEESNAEPKNEESNAEPKKETVSREFKNALRSAEKYLNFTAFSKKGLYDQLLFEGYPEDAAQYAVDTVKTDWNKNALQAAKNYLDLTGFSDQGLKDQLKFEGYTEEQAQYAIDNLD